MISYELALGLSVVPIFLVTGTLNLSEIVQWQIKDGWFIFPFSFESGFAGWRLALCFTMIISFVIFPLVSMFAETNRTPFDLPEAEQELVGGYHTEYSSMGFALFFLGEYAGHDRRLRGDRDALLWRLEFFPSSRTAARTGFLAWSTASLPGCRARSGAS